MSGATIRRKHVSIYRSASERRCRMPRQLRPTPKYCKDTQMIKMLTAISMALMTCGTNVCAAEVPDFMKTTVANEGAPAKKADIAFNDIYALNEEMFPIYDN